LKRLDPDKEIKVNSFDRLWPSLAGFGWIWLDLGEFGFSLGDRGTPRRAAELGQKAAIALVIEPVTTI
jgi:hypothetical protein